ncbi:hypothetical protein GCK72_012903 [Caenorhabditis remanei]|uniref:DUF19 domain-containing protein n=1 Tax=Caenorhabditis remanei TaxID=31234 RepID=A0A6A5GM79_CAERE|nr:hypothetical protein GCK72_012903 [Caenorhabditis remanei]KAF1756450.1 hypothetical protein GCK72_012903 [Caenorhabditis remanei]
MLLPIWLLVFLFAGGIYTTPVAPNYIDCRNEHHKMLRCAKEVGFKPDWYAPNFEQYVPKLEDWLVCVGTVVCPMSVNRMDEIQLKYKVKLLLSTHDFSDCFSQENFSKFAACPVAPDCESESFQFCMVSVMESLPTCSRAIVEAYSSTIQERIRICKLREERELWRNITQLRS